MTGINFLLFALRVFSIEMCRSLPVSVQRSHIKEVDFPVILEGPGCLVLVLSGTVVPQRYRWGPPVVLTPVHTRFLKCGYSDEIYRSDLGLRRLLPRGNSFLSPFDSILLRYVYFRLPSEPVRDGPHHLSWRQNRQGVRRGKKVRLVNAFQVRTDWCGGRSDRWHSSVRNGVVT